MRQRLLVFLTLCTALFVVMSADGFSELVTRSAGRALAEFVAGLLRFFDVAACAEGHRLLVPTRGLRFAITNECVAVPAYATLVALELATGRTALRRIGGLLASCSAFFALNAIRIASLSACWLWHPTAFEFLHEYVWNAAFFVLVTTWVGVRLFDPWVRRRAVNPEKDR